MADSSGIRIVNMREVMGDFRTYDRKTKKAFSKTLRKTAFKVKGNQGRTLLHKVKEWTGTLANTIKVDVRKWWHIEIGPTTDTSYYRFIERGGRPYGNKSLGARAFAGYWYVRSSIRGVKQELTVALKRDIRNSTKK